MKKVLYGVVLSLTVVAVGWWLFWPRPIARPSYVPRIAELRSSDFFVYPPSGSLRGTIVFFGNDVGFWQPHQKLADFLSREGYAVVGFDLRNLLRSNSDASQTERTPLIRDQLSKVMYDAVSEFHGEKLPLLLMGHSLGAEVAIWAGANIAEPRATGIVAMAPGGRGHLAITASDYLSSALPTGPDSFSISDLVKSLPPGMRVALVRGAGDHYGSADPQIVSAGSGRVQRFSIPMAGHSLKKILIARYVVEKAIDWVLASAPSPKIASN